MIVSNEEQQAVNILRKGGIVVFPTDTAFGIGCRIDNSEAIDRLFRLKKRPLTQATPVLVTGIDMSLVYFKNPPQIALHLMKKYWPGALTIIATCYNDRVYKPVRGGGDTIGARMPNYDPLLRIIQSLRVPILGPSANFHGKKTPYRKEDLDPELVELVDYVLAGECLLHKVSTVVDTTQETLKIVRHGAVELSAEEL